MKIIAEAEYGTFIVSMDAGEIMLAAGLEYGDRNKVKVGAKLDLRGNVQHVTAIREGRDRLITSARNLRALADLLERELNDIGLKDDEKKEAA